MEEKQMNFYNYAKQNPCKHINTHTPLKGMIAMKVKTKDLNHTTIWLPKEIIK